MAESSNAEVSQVLLNKMQQAFVRATGFLLRFMPVFPGAVPLPLCCLAYPEKDRSLYRSMLCRIVRA